MSDKAIADLAAAFKNAAINTAWPEISKIFKDAKVDKMNDFDSFFKESMATASADKINAKLVKLSEALLDCIVAEFTSTKTDIRKKVMEQSRNIQIQSKIRQGINELFEKKEKLLKATSDRVALAGLQSFSTQIKNIDETAVLKAQEIIRKEQAIEDAKKARGGSVSPKAFSAAKDAFNDFAQKARSAPKAALEKLAETAAKKAQDAGVAKEQLEQIFDQLDPYKLSDKEKSAKQDSRMKPSEAQLRRSDIEKAFAALPKK